MVTTDSLNRSIRYLRISVTDRCNLRCQYCMPAEGVPWKSHQDILRYEEIERIVRAAVGLGITQVRLTGGEPLVRAGIVDLVGLLARIEGLEDLALTTNGTLLARYAQELARAGLKRVNVSLDTLRAERFAAITRGGNLADTLDGLRAAEEAGLQPLKINMVVMRGRNDDEVVEMARLTLRHPWHVRYIEVMPLEGNVLLQASEFVASAEVRARLEEAFGPLHSAPAPHGNGPAAYYLLPGGVGSIGFISPVSAHFCATCNRLRLTADGRLRPCLLADDEIDLRKLLRDGADEARLQDVLREAIAAKPQGHHLSEQIIPHGRVMSQIGG
jgi:cyclic pyranopterin phosphate synthase